MGLYFNSYYMYKTIAVFTILFTINDIRRCVTQVSNEELVSFMKIMYIIHHILVCYLMTYAIFFDEAHVAMCADLLIELNALFLVLRRRYDNILIRILFSLSWHFTRYFIFILGTLYVIFYYMVLDYKPYMIPIIVIPRLFLSFYHVLLQYKIFGGLHFWLGPADNK